MKKNGVVKNIKLYITLYNLFTTQNLRSCFNKRFMESRNAK